MKENEQNENEIETIEEETQLEENKDTVADALTSKQLLSKVSELVDEKIALAQEAQDNEEEETEEEEKPKRLGLFPVILIGTVLAAGVASIIIKNRPTNHPDEQGERNDG